MQQVDLPSETEEGGESADGCGQSSTSNGLEAQLSAALRSGCRDSEHLIHLLEQIDEVITERPTWGRAHQQRAVSLEALGRWKEALGSYARAIELDSSLWDDVKVSYRELRDMVSSRSCVFKIDVPGSAALYDAVTWGECIICATSNKDIYVIHRHLGSVLVVLEGHEDIVTTLSLSPDRETLVSGSLDKTVRVWDLSDLVERVKRLASKHINSSIEDHLRVPAKFALSGHTSRINRLEWTPCSTRTVSSSTDCTLRLWDVVNGTCLSVMSGHGSLVSSIAVSKTGTLCASASGDAECKLWGIQDQDTQLNETIAWESGPVVLCKFIDYSSHGEYLLSAHAQLVQQQARILLWDTFDKDTGWVDGRLRAPCFAIDDLRGCPTCIDTVRVGGGEFEGTELLACACSDGQVYVWDIDECPAKIETFSLEEPGYSLPEDLPAWSAAQLKHSSNRLNLVKFSPCGTYLAATRSESYSVVVWDIDEGSAVCELYGHTGPIRKMSWTSTRELMTFAEDGTARGWKISLQQD
jgi:WD40 repeat protein